MTVVGVLAGSHVQAAQGQRLRSAGAHRIARSFKDGEGITRQLLAAIQKA